MKRSLAELLLLSPLLFGGSEWAKTQTPATVLPLDAEQKLHLEPNTERSCTLIVPAEQVVSVVFEQSSGNVSVRWLADGVSSESVKAVVPRVNRSGKYAAITFRAIGVTASGGTDTSGSFLVQNQSKRAVDVQIAVGMARAATREDIQIAQSESDTAQAVALSANRTPANLAAALQLLKSSEKQWRIVKDLVELTRVQVLEAYTQAFPMDNGAGALKSLPELLDNAARVAGVSAVEAGNAHKTAGFILAKQAHYDEAIQQYNKALPLFEKNDDTYNRVVVLENRAKVERIQGHNTLALADVQAAIPLAQQNADGRGELALEVERGAIAFSSGQLGLAYEANLRAIALARDVHDDFLEGLAWSDMGVVYTELHNFDDADRALDHADSIWKHTSNVYGQIQTSEDRAETRLAKGNLSGARAAFALGADEAAKSSLDREQAYFLHGLAVSEMRLGSLVAAKEHLNQALQKAERIQITDGLSAIYASAGDLEALQGHWSDATARWKRANELALQRGDTLDHVIALGGLVRATVHIGNLTSASEYCQDAISALESIRTGITDAELRLSFFSSRHALYDLCVQTDLMRGDQRAAFDDAERGRARSLLDQAAASGVQAEFPNGLVARIQENERRLAQERKRLGQSPGKVKPSSSISLLLREQDDLRTEAEQSGLSGILAAATIPLSASEVMQHMDSHSALLTYWLGEKSSRVWWITSKSVSSYSLPSETVLKAKIKSYMGALLSPLSMSVDFSAAERNRAIAQAQASALTLGHTLSRDLLPMQIPAQIRRLLIVKDGAILPLSFAALPAPNMGYLGERFQVGTDPSATFAFRAAQDHSVGIEIKAVVFADPVGANAPSLDTPGSNRVQPPQMEEASWTAALPFARQEALSIRRTFGEQNTTVYFGASASRERVLALDWSSYQLAHFATHAVYRDTHLELSGLVLGTEGVSPGMKSLPVKSSVLSYSDVLHMKSTPHLVVLSACNSGVGKFVPGEGMLAMDNAFLAAGTSTVLSTLWPVDDEASSVFMSYFYRALAKSRSPSLSLQQAQTAMAASQQWNAPYYWGAFSLSGDWRPFSD